jgi:hypothetical protein
MPALLIFIHNTNMASQTNEGADRNTMIVLLPFPGNSTTTTILLPPIQI